MPIVQSGVKQLQTTLPQAQLTKEQNDKFKQFKPLVFKRPIKVEEGTRIHPRK